MFPGHIFLFNNALILNNNVLLIITQGDMYIGHQTKVGGAASRYSWAKGEETTMYFNFVIFVFAAH